MCSPYSLQIDVRKIEILISEFSSNKFLKFSSQNEQRKMMALCVWNHMSFSKKHMYPKNLTAPIHFGWEDEFPFPPVF